MRSGLATKIRVVKCPKCLQILLEQPDVPIYECGGCGTHLQAKIQNINVRSTDAVQTNNVDHVSEDNASSSSSHEATHHSYGVCSSDQKDGRDQIESSDDSEQFTCVNLFHEEQKNGSDQITAQDLPHEEQYNGSDQITAQDDHSKHCEGVDLSNEDQNSGRDENVFDNEQSEDVNAPNECQNNGADQCEYFDFIIEQSRISEVGLSTELANLNNENLSPLAGANSEVEVSDETSPFSGAKAKPDAVNETNSNFRTSMGQKLVDSNRSTSIVTVQRPAQESISSDILISCPDELIEQPEKGVHHPGFVHVRSTDMSEATDFINPGSEFSGALLDLFKSPTTRSSNAYYDDGVSSYEGTDDQLSARHKGRFKNAYKPAKHAASDERARKEKLPVDGNSGMQDKLRNCTSVVSDKINYAIKFSTMDEDELLEPTRFSKPLRNWKRLEGEKNSSQLPFCRSGSMAGYGSSNLSYQWNKGFHRNSSFCSHEKYTDLEKVKLLRMVYELQDELDRVSSLNENTNGTVSEEVTWKEHCIPMFYGREALKEESFYKLNYPGYPQRFREGCKWSQHGKYSRIPFSADTTNRRYQVDHSSCCCSQDWQCSVQLPHGFCHDRKFSKVHSGVESEFPMYSCGGESEEQRHRDHEVKKYLREKRHLVKRHLQPIACVAPFVTCPCCLKHLQLPADFLIFNRCRQLRCGACSELLKFSLVNRMHLVPYTATVKASSTNKADKCSDAIDRRILASTSYVGNLSHIDPVSCSDDYGLSICKRLLQ